MKFQVLAQGSVCPLPACSVYVHRVDTTRHCSPAQGGEPVWKEAAHRPFGPSWSTYDDESAAAHIVSLKVFIEHVFAFGSPPHVCSFPRLLRLPGQG